MPGKHKNVARYKRMKGKRKGKSKGNPYTAALKG